MYKTAMLMIEKSLIFLGKSGFFYVAAGEGFEPSQTESESVVLPLHNPATDDDYYNRK